MKKRRASPGTKIPKDKCLKLVEMCRQGIDFDYACHLIGKYKIEVFEHAKRDRSFSVALTKAVEEGKAADKCVVWLELLRLGHKNSTALRMVGTNMTLINERKRIDPDFALAALEAEHQGTDYLEDVARQRGVNGSDTLLMFVLKARDRARFADTQPTVQVNNNTLNIEGAEVDRYEHGRKLAFALRLAATRQAAGSGPSHGTDSQGPEVDSKRRATNGSVPVPG